MALRVDPTIGLDLLLQDWVNTNAAIIPDSGNVFMETPQRQPYTLSVFSHNE